MRAREHGRGDARNEVPLPSRAFGQTRGHLRVVCVLLDVLGETAHSLV